MRNKEFSNIITAQTKLNYDSASCWTRTRLCTNFLLAENKRDISVFSIIITELELQCTRLKMKPGERCNKEDPHCFVLLTLKEKAKRGQKTSMET